MLAWRLGREPSDKAVAAQARATTIGEEQINWLALAAALPRRTIRTILLGIGLFFVLIFSLQLPGSWRPWPVAAPRAVRAVGRAHARSHLRFRPRLVAFQPALPAPGGRHGGAAADPRPAPGGRRLRRDRPARRRRHGPAARAASRRPGRPFPPHHRRHPVARPLRPFLCRERRGHRRHRHRRGGAPAPCRRDGGHLGAGRRRARGRARRAPRPGDPPRRARRRRLVRPPAGGRRRPPGGVSAARRHTQPELGGGSLHRQQHRAHQARLRPRHLAGAVLHGQGRAHGRRRRERSDDLQQRPAVGPSPAGRHPRPAPDRAPVLRLHVGRHRPLPDQRAAHRGDALGAGDGPRQEPVEPELDRRSTSSTPMATAWRWCR